MLKGGRYVHKSGVLHKVRMVLMQLPWALPADGDPTVVANAVVLCDLSTPAFLTLIFTFAKVVL